MADRLSLYDYLSFVLPGAGIIATAVYGGFGWPWGEPGAAVVVGLVALSFVVGYLNSAVGNFVEALLLGGRPGCWPDGRWGTLVGPSIYDEATRTAFSQMLAHRFPGVSESVAYRMAYTELQQRQLAGPLQLLNQHLGFCRGMFTSSAVCLSIVWFLALAGETNLPWTTWTPLLAGACLVFALRFRRFWKRFGDNVLRGIAIVANAD